MQVSIKNIFFNPRKRVIINTMGSNFVLNNVSAEGEYCYFHFPNFYLTKNKLALQAYADSQVRFFELCGLKIYCNVIDSLVVEFLKKDAFKIQSTVTNCVYNTVFLNNIKNLLKNTFLEVVNLCTSMEQNLFEYNKVDYETFRQLYDFVVTLLAISYLNPSIASRLTAVTNDPQYCTLVEEYLYKDNFSHLIYFNSELDKLKTQGVAAKKQDIIDFCWNVGFARDSVGDGSDFENFGYVQGLLGTSFQFTQSEKPSRLYYPEIPLAEKNIENEAELILYWTKILQSCVEFRHFWSLRFLRNVKCAVGNKAFEWAMEDYEREYFKIK